MPQAYAIRTCRYCGEEVMWEPNVGWVETRTGDQGGNYDLCAESASHAPTKEA